MGFGHRVVKRAFDLLAAAVGLLLVSPVLALVAIGVRLGLGTPVLFRQMRPGLDGRAFTIYKFRTMRDACDSSGNPLPDDKRLTRLGRFLRKTSLDELPELFNVLRGDMSLVGPRPLLMEYLDRYTPHQSRRHEVRPGVTGWAQVNGRQDIPLGERINLDVWYIDHWSVWLDFRILLKTVTRVILGSGVQSGQDFSKFDDLPPSRRSAPISQEKPAPRDGVRP
jgi:sugar transferase EpsL